jgi:hypothetical protein
MRKIVILLILLLAACQTPTPPPLEGTATLSFSGKGGRTLEAENTQLLSSLVAVTDHWVLFLDSASGTDYNYTISTSQVVWMGNSYNLSYSGVVPGTYANIGLQAVDGAGQPLLMGKLGPDITLVSGTNSFPS